MSLKSKFNMSSLPPSSAATEEHSFRTYYQVQKWLGNKAIVATEWGWRIEDNMMYAVHSKKPPAPEEIINLVSFNCKVACKNKTCCCVKMALNCTEMCGYCHSSCSNIQFTFDEFADENELNK